MVKSHWCTEGFLMFGSKAPTAGAPLTDCTGWVNATEGVVIGLGTLTGNPVEILAVFPVGVIPFGSAHPELVVAAPAVLIVVTPFKRKPGTLPAIAVTWNLDKRSNSQQ